MIASMGARYVSMHRYNTAAMLLDNLMEVLWAQLLALFGRLHHYTQIVYYKLKGFTFIQIAALQLDTMAWVE
jgi:hypothetical protein